MKKARLMLYALITLTTVRAQQLAPSITWQKSIGGSKDDVVNAVKVTPDNGFILVGSSKSNDGDVSGHHGSTDSTDAWIVKLSANGNILWQKSLGGTGNDDFINDIFFQTEPIMRG